MAAVRKRVWGTSWSWEASWTEAGVRRKKSGFTTKKDAEDFLTEKRKSLKDGSSRPDAHKLNVADLCKAYEDHMRVRAERKAITRVYYENRKGHINNYIAHNLFDRNENATLGTAAQAFSGFIGHLKLSEVRPSTCELFKDKLLATKLNYRTVRAIISTLSSAFTYGVGRDMLSTNPAAGIRVEPPREARDQRVTPPSPRVVQSILGQANGSMKMAVMIAAMTGVRASELRSLRYENIDFKKLELRVESRVDVYYDESRSLKSAAGRRTIPIAMALAKAIEAHRARSEFNQPTDLVLPDGKGFYLRPKWFNENLEPLVRALDSDLGPASIGGSEKFTWHALRHFAISSWIGAGIAPKAVQTFAGHADINMTMNRYGHLFPSDDHHVKIEVASFYALPLEARL